MNAQQEYESYVNNLFFNVYSDTPDFSIHQFFKEYNLILFRPIMPNVKWTSYPPDDPKYNTITMSHSIFFDKHPYINTNAERIEFKVISKVTDINNLKNQINQIQRIQLAFEFQKLEEADKFFYLIKTDFLKLGWESEFADTQSMKFSCIFCEGDTDKVPCGVKIRLITERSIDGLYQVDIF